MLPSVVAVNRPKRCALVRFSVGAGPHPRESTVSMAATTAAADDVAESAETAAISVFTESAHGGRKPYSSAAVTENLHPLVNARRLLNGSERRRDSAYDQDHTSE